MQELPDLTAAVKFMPVADASKDNLIAAWKSWVEQAGEEMVGVVSMVHPPAYRSHQQLACQRAHFLMGEIVQ